MSEADDWQELMRGISGSVGKAEEAADGMAEAIRSVDRFMERANGGGVDENTLNGLRVGLWLNTTADWAGVVVAAVAELRERLADTDAQVASGELPASAHSWRHQLQERLAALDRRTQRLIRRLAERRKKLETLAGIS
jgi:hypothetical protein